MYDYVIIGSGIAGLSVALAAAEAGKKSLLVTKSHLEESNTRYAQGGIAAAVAAGDSPRAHYADTLVAGAALCDDKAVEVLTEDAPARIAELIRLGVPFDREDGKLELGREGAHNANRILHAGGDATGYHIEHSLAQTVRQSPFVTLLEEHFTIGLLVEEGRVAGAKLLTPSGEEIEVRGQFTVIASGGAGQLYQYTTNPAVTTGDGIALAWRAGAALADLEFFQFHPTALNLPGAPSFLISEAVRGDGAILRNGAGEAFMTGYDARAELAPRDIVARAIAAEMTRTGKPVYLDATHLGEKVIRHRFPSIYDTLKKYGLDMADQPIPVSPAAHYFMGGILTGLGGETTLPGLFACGEAACTGVHGANRLASNSLLEGLVFGRRIYDYTANGPALPLNLANPSTEMPLMVLHPSSQDDIYAGEMAVPTLPELQKLMWEKVGLTREANGLGDALLTLNSWEVLLGETVMTERAQLELKNLVTLARLMVIAALTRTESRGAHYRRDYPTLDPTWKKHITIGG